MKRAWRVDFRSTGPCRRKKSDKVNREGDKAMLILWGYVGGGGERNEETLLRQGNTSREVLLVSPRPEAMTAIVRN